MTTSSSSDSNTTAPVRGNLDDRDYQQLRERVAARFATAAAAGPLFTTDVDLWPIYLDAIAAPLRQHHNCSTCQHFLHLYGGLATIGDRGQVRSAVWDPADADAEHAEAITAMAEAVRRAPITGVFLAGTAELGRAVTGPWAHLALQLPADSPALRVPRPLTAGQAMAARRHDHANVMRALDEFPLPLLDQAVELLKSDTLYRSEHVLGPAQWLRDLAASVSRSNRELLVWRAIATAPAGFCHPRSSMVGTLLEDLASGMGFGAAAERFRAKMHPLQYQRPQTAPTEGQIAAAERLVEQLGIAAALPRRYARLDEVETVWRPPAVEMPEQRGVFGHLLPAAQRPPAHDVPEQRITWARLVRDVLPDAVAIEALVPERGLFCALVTAVDPAAPPILQWDRADRRNRVSWYVYPSGSAARQWGLTAGAWAEVTALTLLPPLWGDRPLKYHGQSAIAIIAGARDGGSPGGGLFPEFLRTEFHGVRATIEAYSKSAKLAGVAESSACGLRFGDRGEVQLRVTTRTGSRFAYRVDRWD